jgi:regulator of extracellular matrix RemA (YlzA/DUF370 family)
MEITHCEPIKFCFFRQGVMIIPEFRKPERLAGILLHFPSRFMRIQWPVRLQPASGENMEVKLLNIGFGNTVIANRVVAIVSPASAPMKRLKEDARQGNKLIDATMGRRTRSIIVTDSDHVILSGVQAETIAQRLLLDGNSKEANLVKQL